MYITKTSPIRASDIQACNHLPIQKPSLRISKGTDFLALLSPRKSLLADPRLRLQACSLQPKKTEPQVVVLNRATTSLFVAAVLLALQVGSAHAGEKVEESGAELFKLIAPTITILVSAVTLSAQLGGLKVRLETIEKAVETNRTELKADLQA
jgi:hypothetical protein